MSKRNLSFTPEAFVEYNDWHLLDKQIIQRIKALIREIEHDPFKGIGKPEPLRGNWSGYWSRRIDDKHRLVYRVTNEEILIAKCFGHY